MAGTAAAQPAFRPKERIIAKPGFNRYNTHRSGHWPSTCSSVVLVYGFSVFWLPLSKALHHRAGGLRCRTWALSLKSSRLNATGPFPCWADLHPVLHLPGCSAAIWGGWLEHAGPRKAGCLGAAGVVAC